VITIGRAWGYLAFLVLLRCSQGPGAGLPERSRAWVVCPDAWPGRWTWPTPNGLFWAMPRRSVRSRGAGTVLFVRGVPAPVEFLFDTGEETSGGLRSCEDLDLEQ
jgi:hypothetical protein